MSILESRLVVIYLLGDLDMPNYTSSTKLFEILSNMLVDDTGVMPHVTGRLNVLHDRVAQHLPSE